jgi:four helix bundle protein
MGRPVTVAPSCVMHDFRRLHVWERSRRLALELDGVTRTFPRSDRGIVSGQLRRASLSIPANIAEGCGKASRKEAIRFFEIASGSAKETEHHIQMSLDLGYITATAAESLTTTVVVIQKMLRSLINNLPE